MLHHTQTYTPTMFDTRGFAYTNHLCSYDTKSGKVSEEILRAKLYKRLDPRPKAQNCGTSRKQAKTHIQGEFSEHFFMYMDGSFGATRSSLSSIFSCHQHCRHSINSII